MSDLEHIGTGLEDVLQRLGVPEAVDVSRLVEEWDLVVGEPWASRSRPTGFAVGELVVDVPDGAVATLLRYQTAALIERLERRFGAGLVERVRVRVCGRKKASDQGERRSVGGNDRL